MRLAQVAAVGLAVPALACGEVAGGGDTPLLTVTPDSATAWVGDTLRFRVADELGTAPGGRQTVIWSVTDTSVARLVLSESSTALVRVRRSGLTFIVAQAAAQSDSAQIHGIEEGELLASYTLTEQGWLQSPAIDEQGILYLLRFSFSPGPTVIALDRGLSLLWERPVASSGALSPALGAGGQVYFSAYSFTAAHASNGDVLWIDTTHSGGETAPAIGPSDRVYVPGAPFSQGLDDWAIAGYDSAGARVFRAPVFRNTVKVAPTIVGDSVIVAGDLAGRVFAFSLSGALIWVDTLPSKLRFFAPSVGSDGRTVYLPARSHVVAMDAFNGTRLWVWGNGDPRTVPLSPVVDRDGIVYVQTTRTLVALNPDGTVRWQADSLAGLHWINGGGAPALAEGGVLYVACGTDLCAVRTSDGSVRWRRALPFPGIAGPIMITRDSAIVFVTVGFGFPAVHAGYDSARVVKLRGRFPLADAPWPVDGGNLRRTRRAAVSRTR